MTMLSDSIARARGLVSSLVAEISILEGHAAVQRPASPPPPRPPAPPPPPPPSPLPDAIGSAGAAVVEHQAQAQPSGHPGFGDEAAFYDWLRDNGMLGPTISGSEYHGCDVLTRAMAAASWPLGFAAYGLATPYHETAHTMQPIHELGGLAYFTRLYDVQGQNPARARQYGNESPGDGARYCGRGFVQLTWRNNYLRAGEALGIDLVGHPELALDPKVAADVMARGMAEGWFSGRKLSDYLPAKGPGSLSQFTEARRIINGTDRAADIAGYAVNFQAALTAGKWRF